MSLLELLAGLAITLIVAMLALQATSEPMARQAVEGASRRLAQGLELGRSEARRLSQPCALKLAPEGWIAPTDPALPPCRRALLSLGEPLTRRVQLLHNVPASVRFSRRGLVIDGGTVVITAAGTPLRRCLVLALPRGVVRLGRYLGDVAQPPDSGACKPDPSL
ncbi:MAG: GspH/FimT family pseudopilin [Cyanobacteriota bacterium]